MFRARTLIGILLLSISSSIAALIYALLSSLPTINLIIASALLCVLVVVSVWILFSLRRSGNLTRCANLHVATLFICMETGLLLSGGPPLSPVMSLLILPPIMAFALGGMRTGLIWSGISFFTQIALIVAGFYGVRYPNLANPNQLELIRASVAILSYFDAFGVVMAYEIINARLQRARDQQHENYIHLATHDALTGIANRSKLMDRLTVALNRINRNGKMVALIYLDLDGFKQINDTFGHEAGDRVLQLVSQRLGALLRKIDTLARVGGDEFAILLEDISAAKEAEKVAQRLLQTVSEPIADYPGTPISGSFGVALSASHTLDGNTLTRMADTAMYQAKKKKNAVVMFDSDSIARHATI